MASRRISVEIIGNAASLESSFAKSGAAAKKFEYDIGRTARGAVAASVSFRGLGRAVAYASGYFLASGGLVFGLKAATKAAIDHQATQAQLQTAVTHSGVSFKTYGTQIEDALSAQRRLSGFTEEDTALAFTKLLRTTKDVGKSLHDTSLAAEIARGANISLSSASNVVNKALANQTAGLRRLGVEIPKGASGFRGLQIAGEKYAGALVTWSKQAAGKQALLTQALKQTEVTVGTALLPTIMKYSGELANWLGKTKNQARLQRDVTQAVRVGTVATKDIAHAARIAASAVGGFKNAAELLIGLKVGSTVAHWLGPIASIGGKARGAAGGVELLTSRLKMLAGIGVVTVGIEILIHRKQVDKAVTGFLDKNGLGFFSGSNNMSGLNAGNVGAAIAAAQKAHDSFTVGILKKAQALFEGQSVGNFTVGDRSNPRGVGGASSTVTGTHPSPKTAAGLDRLSKIQNAVAQARVGVASGGPGAQAQLVSALKAEIDYDRKYAAIQQGLVAKGGKDAKKHSQTLQALLADEASAYSEIGSMNTKAGAAATRAAKKAESALKKRQAAERKAAAERLRQATTFTIPMSLQIAQAKAATTKTTTDDLKVAKAIEAYAKQIIKSHKKRGQALVDAWNEIANQMGQIANITNQTTQHFTQASSRLLTANLGLTRAQRVALEQRYSQAEAHGGHIPTGVGVLGNAVVINVHGAGDPEQVAKKVLTHLQKHAKRNSGQTRGRNGGSYLGLH